MHQALIRQLANQRSGSANTKTRAESEAVERNPGDRKERVVPVTAVYVPLCGEVAE